MIKYINNADRCLSVIADWHELKELWHSMYCSDLFIDF